MKTLIISSGRSGSKFILRNVYNLYIRLELENTYVIYEPYLWNFEFKNIDRLNSKDLFIQKNIDQNALNIHLKTPQYFLPKQNEHQFSEYFNHVLEKLNRFENVIVKINRSPSRMHCFIESGRFDKIIYLYNNPLSLLSRLNNSYGLDGPPNFRSNISDYMQPEILNRYYPKFIIQLYSRENIQQHEKNLLIWFTTNQHFINSLTQKFHYQFLSMSTDVLKLDTIRSLQSLYNFFGSSFFIYDAVSLKVNQFNTFIPFYINESFYRIIVQFHMEAFFNNLNELKTYSNIGNITDCNIEQLKRIIHDKYVNAQNYYFRDYKDMIIKNIYKFFSENNLNSDLLSYFNFDTAGLSFIDEIDKFIHHLSRKNYSNDKLNSIFFEYLNSNLQINT
jgi:hypothetical protein